MTKDLLELDTRRKIFEFIVKFPGVHLRELERSLGMSVQLLDYHLRVLGKGGLVSSTESDKYKRFYAGVKRVEDPKALHPDEKDKLAILRQETPLSIVLCLLRVGSARHMDIAGELDIPSSTLSYHLKKLTKGELIEKIPVGEERGFQLKDPESTLKLLIAYRPLSKDMFDRFAEIWRDLY
ncbi:MAG: ArsR family transcriptional regulator [Thermoplasmata archaeon]|nr:ArsR family transcriptional regulator [Thermoplasmata archaeon]